MSGIGRLVHKSTFSGYGVHMTTTGLEVRLHEGRERAEVTRVAWALNEVVGSLKDIDRVYLLRGTRATWVLADMRRDQHDLVLRVEARRVPAKRSRDDMLLPVAALVTGVAQLDEEPTVPPLFSPKVVTRIAALAAPKQGIQSVSLAPYNGVVRRGVVLTERVQQNAEKAVQPFELTYGSVTGYVSRLTEKRGGKLGFTVRQEDAKQAVEGEAPTRMTEELRAAWRHRVLLGGKLKRNSRGQVIRVDVDRLERLPEDDLQRPSSEDLFGVVPEWVEGLTPDAWMKEVRRG